MEPTTMTHQAISDLCRELLWYRKPRQERFAAEMGLETKILLRCKLPATSKSFRLISPLELAHLIELNIRHSHEAATTMSNSMRKWRKGFDVIDPQGHFLSHHTFYGQALQVADSVNGTARSVGRDAIPELTEEQRLRHRWRKAIYSRDGWDIDLLSAATGYCAHSVARMGFENPRWGLTPTLEAVSILEGMVSEKERIAA